MRELNEVPPPEAARALGISTRKYGSLRRQVEQGKVSSPLLNDLLEEAKREAVERPQLRHEEFTTEIPRRGKRTAKADVWEVSLDWIHKEAHWARDIHPGGFASKRSALNWLGNVGGASQYFILVRKPTRGGRIRWHIYDIRQRWEYEHRGRMGNRKLKAVKKMEASRGTRKRSKARSRRARS